MLLLTCAVALFSNTTAMLFRTTVAPGGVGAEFTFTVACTHVLPAVVQPPFTLPGGASSGVTGPSLQQHGGAAEQGWAGQT